MCMCVSTLKHASILPSNAGDRTTEELARDAVVAETSNENLVLVLKSASQA